jgi:hypothetical protein
MRGSIIVLGWLSLAPVLGIATAARAAAPVARATVTRTSCVAPCAVFFDARTTTDADLPEAFRAFTELTYSWNFGDPGSGVWQQGARAGTADPHPRNVDTGPIAGHVYEAPGAFTAQLTVSDGTSTSSSSLTITVTDPAAAWPGTQTICIGGSVTPVAGQGGCPSGAAVTRNADFDAAVAAMGCNRLAVRCLFRRGDVFTASASTGVTSPGPTLIGAYGTGAKPQIQANGGVSVLRFDAGSHDVRVVDLQIIGANAGDGSALALNENGAQPRRILALRVDLSRFNYQFYFHGPNSEYTPGVNIPSEIALVDSTVLDGAGLGGNDVYVMWERSLLLGSRVGDKFDGLGDGRGEHTIRAKFSHGVVYSHNSMGLLDDSGGRIGCGDQRHVLKLVSGLANTHFPSGVSREYIVADNYVSSCKRNLWDMDLGRTDGTAEKTSEGQQSYIVERNYFTKRFSEVSSNVSLQVEGERGVVRNNVFDLSGAAQNSSPRGVRVWNRAPVANPPVPTRDVRVLNNACYESATTPGRGVCVEVQNVASNTLVLNNVLYDANPARASGAALLLSNEGVNTTTCASCNPTTTANPFASSALATAQDFRPAAASTLVDRGSAAQGSTPMNFEDLAATWVRDGDGNNVAQLDIGPFEASGGTGTDPSAPAAPVLLDN